MKSNAERMDHFWAFSSPPPGSPQYEEFKRRHEESMENNPEISKRSKENYRKAVSIITTQDKNGAGLLVDNEFRHFLTEFNSRIFQFGFSSLPAAFNVLEGFFKFRKDLFLFELFPEEDYLFSSFDFLDFVTSDKKSKAIDYLKDSIEDETIYSYNLINSPKEITFKSDAGKEFIFAGVSMIKREDEVYLFVVGGEKANVAEESKKLTPINLGHNTKSYLKPGEDREAEVVSLLDYNDYRKIFLYLRVNLSTNTIDTRYVQKDNGSHFSTVTDDLDMILRSMKDPTKYEGYIKNSIADIKNYDPIFEVAYNCLYLPEYFDVNEDDLVVEEHQTALASEKIKRTTFKKDKQFSSEHFLKVKDVWTLDKNIKNINNYTFSTDELKIEISGYWKTLQPGQKGKNKNGDVIHNKTWVDKTLSWYESDSPIQQGVKIQTSINKKGYIYILRNPSHPVNVFKIGLTTKTVEERAAQLSGTPSVDKFLIAHSWLVRDCVEAEKRIHHTLNAYRLNEKREFFKIDFSESLKIIEPIIQDINNR